LAAGVEWQAPWQGQPGRARVGVEWRPQAQVALRSGFSSAAAPDQALAPDLGLGLRWSEFSFDWASTQRGALGLTHAATLRWRFAPPATPVPPTATLTPSSTPSSTPVPVLTPTPSAVPTPPPSPVPPRVHRRPTQAPTPTPVPGADGGGFPLFGRPDGTQIALDWQDGLNGAASGYDVYIGLVPSATMRRLNEGPLRSPSFRADVGVRGMTYYFRVKALGVNGQVLAESRLQPVTMTKE
jgi:hypothetical protein